MDESKNDSERYLYGLHYSRITIKHKDRSRRLAMSYQIHQKYHKDFACRIRSHMHTLYTIHHQNTDPPFLSRVIAARIDYMSRMQWCFQGVVFTDCTDSFAMMAYDRSRYGPHNNTKGPPHKSRLAQEPAYSYYMVLLKRITVFPTG